MEKLNSLQCRYESIYVGVSYVGVTAEPLNNGHIRTDHFVHYREAKIYCRLVHWKVSFIQRCPLFRVSFIREGSLATPLWEIPCTTWGLWIIE